MTVFRKRLKHIPDGRYIFEFILPCGYQDDKLESTCAGEFLFLRAWDQRDHPQATDYVPWNGKYRYYGIDGLRGSILMQHWSHVAGRPDVWYVANGWLYSYRWVAENATVR